MVVYVTYRVPVEVELETDTGEIIDVHIVDEKLEGPLGVLRLRAAARQGPPREAGAGTRRGGRVARLDLRLLRPNRPSPRNPCYTLKRNSITSPSMGW
jgi:hypothetical protein